MEDSYLCIFDKSDCDRKCVFGNIGASSRLALDMFLFFVTLRCERPS